MRALIFSILGVGGCLTSTPDFEGSNPEPDLENPVPLKVCDAYEFNGQVYDCDAMDQCTEDDLTYRLACCDCDPVMCNPDPSCPDVPPTGEVTGEAESCMNCHNGSAYNDYAADGLSNPHPFPGADLITCSTCHGGNPEGGGKTTSHVPNPPEIGDDQNLINDPVAYFNFLTLTGADKFDDYTVDGVTYTGLDWLQFRNPGDLRVVGIGRSCGSTGCHADEHATWVPRSPLATEVGFYSGTLFTSGIESAIADQQDIYDNTAGSYGFRAISDPNWVYNPDEVGRVGELLEFPEYAVWNDPNGVYDNPVYDSNQFANYVYADNEEGGTRTNGIKQGTPLADILIETVALTCGDCHLGSAGANNRYGDFRSSGCTSCHMEYTYSGRTNSTDPNVNRYEPANADAIAAPERPHIDAHQIRNVAKTLPGGAFLRGISDKACAGCHQGSNRTVLQFWGVRLDQNQDLENNFQYPANPQTFINAAGDTRFFDPAVNNATFNGRIAEQLIVYEDYDGDGRDDTPEDIHYEKGMGCIDCHGSRDVHAGTEGDPSSGSIWSREDQAMAVECESCHGRVDEYAPTVPCTDYTGAAADCVADRNDNAMRNVTLRADGSYWLTSRVYGSEHYVPQTYDTVVNNNTVNPKTGQLVYSPNASYAMGRADSVANTGIGPQQVNPDLYTSGFSHTDDMECVTCHASWTNSCVGCHLATEYDANPNNYFFSNTTGERIVLNPTVADFVYQSPILFTTGVGSRGLIAAQQPGMKMFLRYTDINAQQSDVFAFSDVNGNGNNANQAGRGAFGALAHNKIMAHSVRGRVEATIEGPRYCVACHLTTDAIDNFGADYAVFRAQIADRDYANLDFDLLQEHIGQNTGNQLNSPFFVHAAAGLGTGLFAFDAFGCPVNPLDANANRQYCQNGAPADNFDANDIVYDLDKVVEDYGITNSSANHPLLGDAVSNNLRAGALYPGLAGPYGAQVLQKLTDENLGLILDSWLDADGQAGGNAADFF